MTSIGLALIVKNEESNLRRLLPQIRPQIDQLVVVDTGSTDGSVAVARELGAEVYTFDWIYDFAAARNFAASKLTTDWQGWCDADDVWQNVDQLRSVLDALSAMDPPVTALWLMYDYDQYIAPDGTKRTIAEHRRERFVRKDTGWHWVRPVHEHQVNDAPGNMSLNDDVRVMHERDRSRDLARNDRNIDILRRALRKDPADARSYYDLGSQYYHTQRWARAAALYKHYTRLSNQPIELYQAWHRMGDCYRYLNKPEQSLACENRAEQLQPDWKDHLFGKAASYFMQGKLELALGYIALGQSSHTKQPDDFLVLNPLDYTFHPLIVQQRCLGALGRIDQAQAVVQEGLAIVPDHDELKLAGDIYGQIQNDVKIARSAFELAEDMPPENLPLLFASLPERVRKQNETRDRLLKPFYSFQRTADVVIYCGASLEDWGPYSPETTGIGGSETAVVEMARSLARLGLNVDVYNQCGAQEGIHENVRYLDHRRISDTPTKLLVAWRNPSIGHALTKADQKWLWLHDLHLGPNLTARDVAPFDLVRPVSAWHASHLGWLYPFLESKLVATRNGINPARFRGEGPVRQRRKLLWCSAPDRGLDQLLRLWPSIREQVPDATLDVYYGWESFDRTVQMTRSPEMAQYKRFIQHMLAQDGITYNGRVPQHTLAQAMRSAGLLAYTTQFLEVSCITAMEAQAAGCVVVSTLAGALPETLGPDLRRLLVRGHPRSETYQKQYLAAVLRLLTDDDQWREYSEAGKERAAGFDWRDVAQEWHDRLVQSKGDIVAA